MGGLRAAAREMGQGQRPVREKPSAFTSAFYPIIPTARIAALAPCAELCEPGSKIEESGTLAKYLTIGLQTKEPIPIKTGGVKELISKQDAKEKTAKIDPSKNDKCLIWEDFKCG